MILVKKKREIVNKERYIFFSFLGVFSILYIIVRCFQYIIYNCSLVFYLN
jgi:hypothetical protein